MTPLESLRRFRLQHWLVLMVGLGVLVLLGFRLLEASESAGRRVGITMEKFGDRIEILEVDPEGAAERAGIRSGDQLVRMAGEELQDYHDYDVIAADFERGRPVEFELLREGRPVQVMVLPGGSFPFLEFAILVPVILAYLALGLLALFQGHRDLRAKLLALLVISVAIELVLPLDSIGAPHLDIAVHCIYLFLTGLEMSVELHLVSIIPVEPPWYRKRPWMAIGFYVLGIGLALPALLGLLKEATGTPDVPWAYEPAETLLLGFGMPLWALAAVFILSRTAVRYPDPVGRHQAGLVLVGVLPWALWIGSSAVVEQLGGEVPQWIYLWEPLILLCLPLATFTAIFRYHLFDLELVVRRSLVYTTLTAMLVLIFYLTVGAGGALLSSRLGGTSQVWTIAAATLLMGLLFSPLRDSVQRVIDRNFFRERAALRSELVKLAGALPSLGSVPSMGQELVRQLCRAFGVDSATLLIANPESGVLSTQATHSTHNGSGTQALLLSSQGDGIDALRRARRPMAVRQIGIEDGDLGKRLEQLGIELAVPILVHQELVGLLLLKGKSDGEPYVAEERELLSLLAHQVGTIFENARLFESATRDGLTGLLRRGATLEELERELRRASRFERPLTVAMADLDFFKRVNDEHGHLAGDLLLRRIANCMSEGLRGSDVIGRYGGEEFLILLPETEMAGAIQSMEKVRSAVADLGVEIGLDTQLTTTISIGLASLAEVEATGSSAAGADLIAVADARLYEAKHKGRDRVEPSRADAVHRLSVVKK